MWNNAAVPTPSVLRDFDTSCERSFNTSFQINGVGIRELCGV